MSLYHNWLQKIKENPCQWDALKKPGHVVVIAGPGSGKTRVLAIKIAQLLRDEITPPQGKVDPFVKTPKVLFLKCISPLCEMVLTGS